jgi:tRNA pseudouridine38-40 synthase
MPRRYKIIVSYDGTAYHGWQIQPNGRSIQDELEKVVKRLTGSAVKVHGSGRTDQGVHAVGQVAHFDLEREFPLTAIRHGLNGMLPPDIRIMDAAFAAPDFHARHSATGKVYRYYIWNGEILPPILRHYRTHCRHRLDVTAMADAARALEGVHDFAAFTANPKREVESTIRDIRELKVCKRGREILIVANGSGFLYKMVRSLAGFLMRVGDGSLKPEQATEILASRERTARVETAAPEGLFLWKVFYD